MALDNRTFGLALGPDPAFAHLGAGGVRTPFGMLLPPGGNVACYLRSTGIGDQDPPEIQNRLVKTLAEALRYVRVGKGDTIIVLPGHTENVVDATMLDNLVSGTRIVGVGHGIIKPTFVWTAAGAKWTLDQPNVVVTGLTLAAGAAITRAVEVTASNNLFAYNSVSNVFAAAAKMTIFCDVAAGADQFSFVGNLVVGTQDDSVTDGLLISAAVKDTSIQQNLLMGPATSANGLIRISAAALRTIIANNVVYNTLATPANVAIALGTAAATGLCSGNRIGITTAGAMVSGTHGISFGGAVDFRFFDNLVSDSANGRGIDVITAAA